MNLTELRDWLEAQGFRIASNPVRARDNEAHWYAYRRSEIAARECQCNDGKPAQIVIEPHSIRIGDTQHESIEVALTGEYETWWNLRAYGIRPDELTADRLRFIEAALVRAWNALESA